MTPKKQYRQKALSTSQPLVVTVPKEIADLLIVASVSGGKDSTALLLALREAGIPHRMVFADTGWETFDTYAQLDALRRRWGPIDWVRAAPIDGRAMQVSTLLDGSRVAHAADAATMPWESPEATKAWRRLGAMWERMWSAARFSSRKQRWCTRELKIEPLRAYHDAISDDTVSAVGVRGDESAERAGLAMLEDEPAKDAEGHPGWGGWVWRPLIAWSIADVLRLHARHGVAVNPLYRRGHGRVGCYPCINSNKEEIALIAENDPDVIDDIEELEAHATEVRRARNGEHVPTAKRPVRYKTEQATYFQGRKGSPLGTSPGIRDVVTWARTDRGGRQLPLLAEPPKGGCMRWGLCDPPSE